VSHEQIAVAVAEATHCIRRTRVEHGHGVNAHLLLVLRQVNLKLELAPVAYPLRKQCAVAKVTQWALRD
jgi:hypothetical protein